jgi:3-oxoacyl-[acyl-carrier protein] reductase
VREYRFEKVGIKVVEAAFVKFHELMKKIKEPYFLIGGTLLGCKREGHLLIHDKDIDIGFPDEATLYRVVEKLKYENYFEGLSTPGGVRNGKLAWARKYPGENTQVAFELQAHYRQGDKVFYNRPMGPSWPWREGRCEWPEHLFNKFDSVEAYGLKWPTPSPIEEFLVSFYGSEWKVEKHYTDWRYNCACLKEGWIGPPPTIMIAGGSHGIGGYLAWHMRKKGFNVSLCGRSLTNSQEGGLLHTKCDVTDRDQINNWIERTRQAYGYVDVLIFSVGQFFGCELIKSSLDELDNLYQTMIRGYMNVLQLVLPVMVWQKDGYVINIGSTRGITSAPGKAIYSAAKRGAHAITDTINLEHNGDGVFATSANFGLVYTDSTIKLYGSALREMVPGPIGMDDVAKTVDYLMSLSRVARPKQVIVGGVL